MASLVLCYAIGALGLVYAAEPAKSPGVEEITRRLVQSEERKALNLREFSVLRRYTLRNSHLGGDAGIWVRFSYRKGQGKRFEVVDWGSVSGIGRKVLERVLEAEVEATHPDGLDESSLTPAHYDFTLLGMAKEGGRDCYILGLRPKQKSKFLIAGKAWIDARDFALVKLEGRPAANVSFWVGKPLICQNFEKIGAFWMASVNHSSSESRLLGKSDLTIQSSGYQLHDLGGASVALRPRHSGSAVNE